MNLLNLFLIIGCFTHAVYAVLTSEAFSKDWFIQHFNTIRHAEFSPLGSLVVITESEQMVSFKPYTTPNVAWHRDLQHLGNNLNFTFANQTHLIAVHSPDSNFVSLFSTESGNLIRRLSVPFPVKVVSDFYDRGLIILDVQGNISFLDFEGNVISILEGDHVNDVFISNRNAKSYIVTDTLKSLILDYNLENITSTPLSGFLKSFGQVRSVDGDLLITIDSTIYSLGAGNISLLASLDGIANSDGEILFSINEGTISFYGVSKSGVIPWAGRRIDDDSPIHIIHQSFEESSMLLMSDNCYHLIDYSDVSKHSDSVQISSFPRGNHNDVVAFIISKHVDAGIVLKALEYKDFGVSLWTFSPGSAITYLGINMEISVPKADNIIMLDGLGHRVISEKIHSIVDVSDFDSLMLVRWIRRILRHLSSMGQFSLSKLFKRYKISNNAHSTSSVDYFGMNKALVYFDEISNSLVAVSTVDGSHHWRTKLSENFPIIRLIEDSFNESFHVVSEKNIVTIDSITGQILSSNSFEGKITGILVSNERKKQVITILFEDSTEVVHIGGYPKSKQFFLQFDDDNALKGGYVDGSNAFKTWSFGRTNEEILTVKQKQPGSTTGSLGISLSDKSVLYKYLNHNVIAVLTKTSNQTLKLYILDGFSGNTLHIQEHKEDICIDFNSINVSVDDNWIVYTFLVTYPSIEQRINVIELFSTKESAVNNGSTENNKILTPQVEMVVGNSFVFPERIVSLSSTRSKNGITMKSLLFLTDSGNLVEVPIFMINGRRTRKDADNAASKTPIDPRLPPYEPIIPLNSYSVLNHMNKIELDRNFNSIIVKPTELESTSVVCIINKYNTFCTTSQPSLSFDFLRRDFGKMKVLSVIIFMLIAYVVSSHFVSNKNLNDRWIDRA